jgi:hypothetical protein
MSATFWATGSLTTNSPTAATTTWTGIVGGPTIGDTVQQEFICYITDTSTGRQASVACQPYILSNKKPRRD